MTKKTGIKLVDGINALVVKNKHCGLHFYGVADAMGPLWWLDGITPVGAPSAIYTLKQCGEDVAALEKLLAAQEAKKAREWERKQRLIESAKKKLTKAEIAACFS